MKASPESLAKSLLKLPEKRRPWWKRVPPDQQKKLAVIMRYYRAGKYDGISKNEMRDAVNADLGLNISKSTFNEFLRSAKHGAESQEKPGQNRQRTR